LKKQLKNVKFGNNNRNLRNDYRHKKYNDINNANRLNNKYNTNNYNKPNWNNQIQNKNTSEFGAYWNGSSFPYNKAT